MIREFYKRKVRKARNILSRCFGSNVILMIINGIFVRKSIMPVWKLFLNFFRRIGVIQLYSNGVESAIVQEKWTKILEVVEEVKNSGYMGEFLVNSSMWTRIGMTILLLMVMQTIIIQLQAVVKTISDAVDGKNQNNYPRGGKH